jgi:hypothetical protein
MWNGTYEGRTDPLEMIQCNSHECCISLEISMKGDVWVDETDFLYPFSNPEDRP